MDRFTEKDEFGGNKLVLRPTAEPGKHIEPWCVSTAGDGTVTIRGAAVDRLAEYEDFLEGKNSEEDFMAKQRNCRRTKDENAIHEKAVKMRKMTDEQLVHYVEDRVEKARSEGYNQGKKQGKPGDFDPAEFIEGIGEIPGIGQATMEKIRGYAMEGGYVQ